MLQHRLLPAIIRNWSFHFGYYLNVTTFVAPLMYETKMRNNAAEGISPRLCVVAHFC